MKKHTTEKIKKSPKARTVCTAKTRPPKIRIKHTQKNITSRGGLVSVLRFIDSIDYAGLFNRESTFQRGANARYSLFDMVLFSTIGYISGISTLFGTTVIWKDKVLQTISGYTQIPDETTIGRVFGRLKAIDIAQFEDFIHQTRKRVWKKSHTLQDTTEKLWVDADSTVITTSGNQEGAAKGYSPIKKGAKSYHPLLAFAASTKEILQGWFRTGSAYTGNGIVSFMKQLLAQMDENRKIVFRADSGFFNGDLFEWLEEGHHDYLVKVKLKNLNTLLSRQSWSPVDDDAAGSEWEQASFEYKASTWSQSRRFKAVRKKRIIQLDHALYETVETYDYFCYVSTLNLTPWQMHRTYGQRATSETWIEEAKSQIRPARMHGFFANAAAFQSAILAYNTLKWMVLFTQDKVLKRMEVKTIRMFLIHTAAKLTHRSRTYTLNFAADHLYAREWHIWLGLGAPS